MYQIALSPPSNTFFQVSSDGELLYHFDPAFKQKIRSKSRRIKREEAVAQTQIVAAKAARIAFGGVLLASIATVGLAIAAIAGASAQSDRDSRDRGGRGGAAYYRRDHYYSGPHFFINLSDLMWYGDCVVCGGWGLEAVLMPWIPSHRTTHRLLPQFIGT